MECGPVLFHLRHTWVSTRAVCKRGSDDHSSIFTQVEGALVDRRTASAALLRPGAPVNFHDRFLEGNEYYSVSQDGFMRQAVAVWQGPKPDRIMREVTSEAHKCKLDSSVRRFLDLVDGDAFLHVKLVRGRGKITGYLTDQFGLIETSDGDCGTEAQSLVFFHVNDAHLFRESVTKMRDPIDQVLPAGLKVIFDARRVYDVRGVTFQACAVFAGGWPSTPHPTM